MRLYSALAEELENISEVFFWTDSRTVLQYLCNSHSRYKTFVANRVSEILDVTASDRWRFVPGKLNPAIPSVRDLSSSHRWINGPEFLWAPCSNWPVQEQVDPLIDDVEIKKVGALKIPLCPIDCRKYSSLSRLLCITAYYLRFVHNLLAFGRKIRLVFLWDISKGMKFLQVEPGLLYKRRLVRSQRRFLFWKMAFRFLLAVNC